MNYFINVGSNLGNRRLNLSRAVRGIMNRYGWLEMSKVIESRPWGYESEHPFLNVGLHVTSSETPERMLASLQEIERSLGGGPHRDAQGGYMDRLVDIDIVAVDELQIDTPDLKVPHPRLAERSFFLEPMIELAPIWKHPATGLTCGEMLANLAPEGRE